MRKLISAIVLTLLCAGHGWAKLNPEDYKMFNHLGVGVSLGLDGIGFDLAAPMGSHFAVRAGGTFMPKFGYTTSIDLGDDEAFSKEEVEIKASMNSNSGHLLFDYYPFKKNGFHLTAGAIFGSGSIISVKTTEPFLKESYWGNAGIELGRSDASIYEQYTLTSDDKGEVKVEAKANAFKPYVGIGFGHAIPKRRLNLTFDLGVQFWGHPGLYANVKYFDFDKGDYVRTYEKVEAKRVTNPDGDYEDVKDVIDVMGKIIAYPVLKITLRGRIF